MNLSLEELKNVAIILYSNTRTVQIVEFPEISHLLNQHNSSLARHVKAGLLIFRAVAEPRISGKSAKSREIR